MADIKVRLVAGWCGNDHLREVWNRMTPHEDYRWNDIVVLPAADRSPEEYFVVLNCPKPDDVVVPARSILFYMEPRAHFAPSSPWDDADEASAAVGYIYGRRNGGRNNIEWHLARTYRQLKTEPVEKTRLMSSVASGLTSYPGHRLRYQFLEYLDARVPSFDLYGRDPLPLASYRGPLPYYAKDPGLFPYRYTFAAENTQERGYLTEKLADAVLSECLCFYWGCPNAGDYIDPGAYCALDIRDPAGAIEQILAAIGRDEWSRRIEAIRHEKARILDELQFFPTLERILAGRPPERRRVKIAFHDNQLGARGTTVALYDYARHNEEILGNASVILYPAAAPRTEAAVEARFRRRFRCLAYADRAEIEKVVRREGIDAVYWIRFGTREPLPGACRHLVHAVFAHDPHGDRYALVSEWLAGRHGATAPWVPHMIDLPPGGDDLRDRLGIPREAVVIGRYGGHDTFDVPFVHEVVARCARSRPDVFFLFADTDRFAEEHPQIVHLGVLVEPARKAAFIDTCDAMLHARQRGETFGLAVGEFSSRNRPVLTYGGSRERSHIDILGHRGIRHRDAEELAALLGDIRRVVRRRRDWNAYRAFTPARVMARFHEVFLAGLEPPPAAGGGRARAVVRVNAAFDVYCINLARHPKRWRRSREEFGRQGLRVERFEGVDGSTLAFDDLVEAGLVREPFDPIERRKAGALGLIATSVALWRKVAEGAEGRWALVCEDDVRFHPGFLDLFEVYWREVPPDVEIVYFGFQYPWGCDPLDESVLSNVSTPVGRHVLRVTRPVNGTHAYAVTARSARRLLDERVPLQSAVDKFPPDRFNVYAFRRPPGTDRATVEDLYVDDQLWEGKHRVSQHGLISTRAEPSTIGHLPYHYLWFARHEREQRNFAEAFDYLMRIKRSPTMYDAATNDFALWHELTVTAFYVDRREGVHAFEELIERSGRAETRAGLLRHERELLDCVEHYRLPGLAASLRGAIARLKAPAG